MKNRQPFGLALLLYPALALGASDAGAPAGAASTSRTGAIPSERSPVFDNPTAEQGGRIEYQGIVELEERSVAFEFGGRIRALHVDRGANVEEGALIAELDTSLEEQSRVLKMKEVAAASAHVDLLRAGARREDLRSMEARVRAAKAVEGALERKVQRERALRASGVGLDAVVDDVAGQYDRAQADREALEQQLKVLRAGVRSQEVAAAVARLEAAETSVKLADLRLSRYRAQAPLTGSVLDVHFRPGEVVPPGAAVVTLGDRTHPYVDVFVPARDVARAKQGTPAHARVDSIRQVFSGVVEHVARKTEFTPRYLFSERERPNLVVRVRVRIADPTETLAIGVPAFVAFAAAEQTGPASSAPGANRP